MRAHKIFAAFVLAMSLPGRMVQAQTLAQTPAMTQAPAQVQAHTTPRPQTRTVSRSTATASSARPVVLELFTSEGCSSCPPAERLLARLAQRPGVLALGFHVTYWNDLGWHDPWSLAAATARQRHYARFFAGGLFTPELVVDGRRALVGSDAAGARAAIRLARPIQHVALTLRDGPGGVTLLVDAGVGGAERDSADTGGARLLLFGYDPHHTTAIGRGENAGRTLHEANIVRSITVAAGWHGAAERVLLPRPQGQRLAAILQTADGHILAVATAP